MSNPSYFRTIEFSDPRFEQQGLRHITVKSKALNMRGDITIYVPDLSSKKHEQPLPIIILLHGVYGSHWAWAFKAGAHLTADRLIREGSIDPFILAMPSDGLKGDGSGYFTAPPQDFD